MTMREIMIAAVQEAHARLGTKQAARELGVSQNRVKQLLREGGNLRDYRAALEPTPELLRKRTESKVYRTLRRSRELLLCVDQVLIELGVRA